MKLDCVEVMVLETCKRKKNGDRGGEGRGKKKNKRRAREGEKRRGKGEIEERKYLGRTFDGRMSRVNIRE